ncbi:unnamed protein product [Clonostachys rosea]|uniref:Autophagy-related protein 27 n=1 Tax=Bionectria ochroleuca TaxID=29856 RepID=A0ABY6UNG1_BIOOC|nr:unnamed protein product [Clonostachys rosea]
MAGAIATYLALISHLHFWHEKPTKQWPKDSFLGLFSTLQASVAWFTTILRALILCFVAEAINQLRWYYTQHSTAGRRIGFLQALDDASRGIYGSFTLLLSRDFLNWSSIGCIITIAAFLIGPLTQNAVKQETRANDPVAGAKLNVAKVYRLVHSNGNANELTAQANIEAAIVNGWGHYASLQFEKDDRMMEKVFPTPLICPDKSRVSCSWRNISNLAVSYECATKPIRLLDLDKDYELNMTASMTRPKDSALPKTEHPLIIHVRATGRPREKNDDYVEHAECALYWRIRNFSKAIYNGTLYQEDTKYLPDLPVEHEGSSIKWEISKSVFEVMNGATQGLSTSMSSCFNRTILRNPNSGKLTYDEMATRMFRDSWNKKADKSLNKLALQKTLTSYVKNVALYTSAAIRAQSDEKAPGYIHRREEIYVIKGLYLIYPLVVLVLSILFFLVTIYMTWTDEIWKSSLLPLLYHGFAEPFPDNLETMVEMTDEADDKAVELKSDGEKGLRLYEKGQVESRMPGTKRGYQTIIPLEPYGANRNEE